MYTVQCVWIFTKFSIMINAPGFLASWLLMRFSSFWSLFRVLKTYAHQIVSLYFYILGFSHYIWALYLYKSVNLISHGGSTTQENSSPRIFRFLILCCLVSVFGWYIVLDVRLLMDFPFIFNSIFRRKFLTYLRLKCECSFPGRRS